jgi:chemosensory pili system protein ChpA (sensor histidine kinase/response regulator)
VEEFRLVEMPEIVNLHETIVAVYEARGKLNVSALSPRFWVTSLTGESDPQVGTAAQAISQTPLLSSCMARAEPAHFRTKIALNADLRCRPWHPRYLFTAMPRRILAVDDDPEITAILRHLLELHGYEVREENESRAALPAAREFQPDFVILDYSMPGSHGGDVAWDLANDPLVSGTRIIFCSGLSEDEVRSKLPPTKIPILSKPINAEALLALLRESGGVAAAEFRRPKTLPW